MSFVYTQQNLFDAVDADLRGKSAQSDDRQMQANRAVRFILNDVNLRSTKRKETLSPNLFADVYDYTAPSTLKARAIIDLRRQVNRPNTDQWSLVDEEEFDRKKGRGQRIFTITEDDSNKLLRIDGGDSDRTTINECNSVTGNGTWAAVAGTDASNVTTDTDNFISAGGSVNFDMAAGAATGAIENSTMTQVDLTDHDEKSSIFVWVFIPDYSDAEGDTVTNFILRWGNDSSNYWSRTITTNNEGLTFYDGWNLLRFDWNGATETGTVDPATIDYIRLTVTKSASLAADTDWRIDSIVSRIGDIYDVIFYSKYLWQTTAGVYIENSTTTTDKLNVDTDEFEGIVIKTSEYIAKELKEWDDVKYSQSEYGIWRKNYNGHNPSESKRIKRSYGSTTRLSDRFS